MKRNISRLNIILHYLCRINITVIVCTLQISAQQGQQQQPEFPLGVFLDKMDSTESRVYDSLEVLGVNYVVQYAHSTNQQSLSPFNVMAVKEDNSSDAVSYYSRGYYTKWHGEEDQQNEMATGIKHEFGFDENFGGVDCWTSGTNQQWVESLLIYGPHYRQDKKYRLQYKQDVILYKVVYRTAVENIPPLNPSPEDTVCKIAVVFKYREYPDLDTLEMTFDSAYIKVGDYSGNQFRYDTLTYFYPLQFTNATMDRYFMGATEIPGYDDEFPGIGIEFRVQWLGYKKLFVDYVEVYDGGVNGIWERDYMNPIARSTIFIPKIFNFANRYTSWDNLKYWFAADEPQTLDQYTPMRIVDSLLLHHPSIVIKRPIITEFMPQWNGWRNGDKTMLKFIELANPEKLMMDYFPFWLIHTNKYGFDLLQERLQEADSAQGDFWYVPQSFGQIDVATGNPVFWRKPDTTEMKASVFLALAHGTKGIVFWKYAPGVPSYEVNCSCWVRHDVIVDANYNPTELYHVIKQNISPRLKGKLGKTLMNLNYTGDYIPLYCNGCPNHDRPSIGYLTLDCEASNFHWHCGFFEHKTFPDNKYFLLTNLRTIDEVTAILSILNNTGYKNLRFANVEGGIDTTIGYNTSMTYFDLVPPGEGRLYQVAPVVLFGGRLRYPELVGEQQVLTDDMIIENGATLTVYNNYFADGNIIVKNGSIVNGENGKIQFANGKKLIIEGAATIAGTASHKLIIDFVTPEKSNGIIIERGASLTISYCEIKNAVNGINSEINANYLNAQNVDFINCETHSISIAGRRAGMPQTPIPQINNCTMSNSEKGIWITNLSGVLIQYNNITNTDLGIYLSNVTDAQIIGNGIYSSTEALEGIISISSGGVIRGNGITGHTVGIHLANSSPKLGGNRIYYNRYHGLYIGSGSRPNMRSELAGNPPITYAISGYNEIKENGGYEDDGGPEDNDGSEIYFVNSNALMVKGCNLIYDDREPEPPLVNTYLLMNCPAEGHPIYVDARGNYWGYRVEPGRFGNLRVDYIPYNEQPCPEPQSADGEFVLMTSFGDIIDTVYSIDVEITEMTEAEEAFAEAEEYFLTGDLTNALQVYEAIISSNATEEEKYLAFERKYSIGKLTGQTTEFFNQLSNTFSTLASNTLDTLNAKILNQLSTLSKVGEQEYETAIGEFDVVIQQNPNTEEAVYAEIDALTTALLVEGEDSTLRKGRLGKYLVKTSGDYNQRIDEILRKNFGNSNRESEEEILPTEYTLYQNYPNPFNPITTIKYDLPNTSEVTLIIYDILGRKVKELINTKQQAGRYEVQFDASSLASGVYIYQLLADEFISSKKMILLK